MQLKLLSLFALSSAALADLSGLFPGPVETDVIDFYSLPTLFPPPIAVDPIATEAIRQTLALYPFAIDGKNFDALSKVFTSDAVANYSAPLNVLTPLSSIKETLKASLACVTTQHQFGTQLIDIVSPFTAQSITYYRAAHFGKGNMSTEVATAYGQYQDVWKRQSDGTWRIVHRNLVYMVPTLLLAFSFLIVCVSVLIRIERGYWEPDGVCVLMAHPT
jgi:ketosteroid isomerase-like protein